MSLNHIIKDSVSDTEALSVKFNNVDVVGTLTGGGSANYERFIWQITNEPITIVKQDTRDDYIGLTVSDATMALFITQDYLLGGTGTASIIKNGVVSAPKTIDFSLPNTNLSVSMPNNGDIVKIMVSHNSDDFFTPYEITLQRTNLYMNAVINRIKIPATPLP